MSILNRAWYYITRKRRKSCILLVILVLVSLSLISSLTIKRASQVMKQKITSNINSSFVVSAKDKTNFDQNKLSQVAKQSEIKATNYELKSHLEVVDRQLVALENKNVELMNDQQNTKNITRVTGLLRSDLEARFAGQSFDLVQGRHLTEQDRDSVLVHQKFLERNKLKLGDTIKLAGSKQTFTAKIVGVFTGKNERQTIDRSELVENLLFTNLATLQKLTNQPNQITQATLTVKNPQRLTSVITQAKQQLKDSPKLKLDDNAKTYQGILDIIKRIESLMNLMVIGITVSSAIVLCLILIFWIQGRTRETGIMMSIGIGKSTIVAQYVLEVLMIMVLSFGLAIIPSKVVAHHLGNNVINQVNRAQSESTDYTKSAASLRSLNSDQLAATWAELGMVLLIESGLVIISIILAAIPIIRLKPKAILAKLS